MSLCFCVSLGDCLVMTAVGRGLNEDHTIGSNTVRKIFSVNDQFIFFGAGYYAPNMNAISRIKEAAVTEKYSRMKQHNRRIRLLGSIIVQIKRLQVDLAEFHNTTIPEPFSPMDGTALEYVTALEAMHFNLTRKSGQMKPLTQEGYKQEMAAAQETLALMQQKAEEEEMLQEEYKI